MKIYKLILFSILSVSFLTLLTNCQKTSGGGDPTTIPAVSVSCVSSNCASASGVKNLYIYVTTSGCLSASYGQVATGTGTVVCSGGACTSMGSISWTDTSRSAITTLPSDSYDFCSLIDVPGTYAGTVSASDSTSSQSTVFIGSSATPVSSIGITNWINGTFTN